MMRPKIDPLQTHLSETIKHPRPLIACRFDPSGRFLFFSSEDESIQRIDLWTKQKVAFIGHPSWVRGMAFRTLGAAKKADLAKQIALNLVSSSVAQNWSLSEPDPFELVSGDYHGKLMIWDGLANEPKPRRQWDAHDGWIRAVDVHTQKKLIATCGNDQLVKVWSAETGELIRRFEGHEAHVYQVGFHPQLPEIVSADLLGKFKFWDLNTGKETRTLEAKDLSKYDPTFRATIGGIRSLSIAADGKTVAASGITNVSNAFAGVGNPLVILIDWASAKITQTLKPKAAFQGTGWGVVIHPENFIIGAGGGSGGQIWFWKANEPASFHTVIESKNIRDLALHPGGEIIATACSDGNVKLFRMSEKPKTIAPAPPAPKAPAKKS